MKKYLKQLQRNELFNNFDLNDLESILNCLSPKQAAIATGFSSATLALSAFVFVGLCLSLLLSFVDKKRSDGSLEDENKHIAV